MESGDRLRVDMALVSRGLAPSRAQAQALIRQGLVTLNGAPLSKASLRVGEQDRLEVTGQIHPYVSRGGLKLEKALSVFNVDPRGQVCMDIGASTGGFTDVLLQNGATRVYAIDVGTRQLDERLREDPRVISMEHTNARSLNAGMFPEQPRLAVMDVSFISIQLILPSAFAVLGEEGRMISLIKPQFEAGPEHLGKKGVVSDPKAHEDVLCRIVGFVRGLGWRVRALDYSPVTGSTGNLEFLGDFLPDAQCPADSPSREEIRAIVREAHRRLRAR